MVNGEGGADLLFGNRGDDILNGGAMGNDTLVGGAGADNFVFEGNIGKDIISDFDTTVDRLTLTGAVTATQVASDTVLTLTSGATITLTGLSADAVTSTLFTNGNAVTVSTALPSANPSDGEIDLGDFDFA